MDDTDRREGTFRGPLLLLVAAVLFLAAAVLVGVTLSVESPHDQPSQGRSPPPSGLPSIGDLTLGGRAGEVLLGLTVRPAEPGPNQVIVYVLPLGGEDQAAAVRVDLSVEGDPVSLQPCGPTCRRGELSLAGSELLSVSAAGPRGGTQVFQLPTLPPPDGSDLFGHMQRSMHSLHAYRLEETLRSGRVSVRADYAFEAPNRMSIHVRGGVHRIIVGRREWRRDHPDGSWQEESAVEPTVPTFIWDGRQPVAPTVIGTDSVGGVSTSVLSFLGVSGVPIWFRLWVDDSGLVRRAEMRAQGHFMDHRYFAFNGQVDIEPPT